jgi:hypothetical protein
MKKCTKQYLCILGLGASVLVLIYIYLAYTTSTSSSSKVKEGATDKTAVDDNTTTLKKCSSITGKDVEKVCLKTYYGSGSGDKCIYDKVGKRCIRPANETDSPVVDDGTNGPDKTTANSNAKPSEEEVDTLDTGNL